jgi:hypothetical protein
MASKIPYGTLYPNTHVRGFEEVIKNLQFEINQIKGASEKGLIKAGIEIRLDTERTAPITPLDYGNLRSSWFITSAKRTAGRDKWNKGFKSTRKGSKRKVDAAKMAADHSNTISESKAKLASLLGMGQIGVTMGYSAFYAVYVHENMNAKFKRQQPAASGPKWFQSAVYRNKDKIVQVIAQIVRIAK